MKRILLLIVFISTSSWMMAQRTVTGTVTDNTGEALIGANVIVQGTDVGTITDIDGNFSVNVPDGSNTLEVSYIGFKAMTVDISGLSSVNITMSEGEVLDELVVMGYGTQKKQQITGSVTSIKAEDVEQIQSAHVVQGLEGKVAGVQIIQQNGQPGSSPTVLFRGIGSINASSSPLYVVDGVPFNGNINSIAPQDIESVNFLKDASANALYGSRGANGVIVVTTKKGRKEGISVTLDTKIGISDRAVPDYDIITDPGEYYETWYNRIRISDIMAGTDPATAAQNAAAGLISNGDFSLGYNNYNVADDMVIDPATGSIRSGASLKYQDSWEDELFSSSTRSETHLGISSGSESTQAYLSLGYLDDEGYALNSGFDRLTTRAKIDFTANDYIKLGANVNYAKTDQDAPIQNVASNTYSNAFSWARNVAPIYPVYAYDENGDRIYNSDGSDLYDFGTLDDGIPGVRPYGAFNNPVATSLLDIDNNALNNLSTRAYVGIDFLENFNFRYNVSADYIGQHITAFATPIGGDASSVNGRLTTTNSTELTVAHQQLLSWRKELGNSNLSILLGHEHNNNEFDLVRGQKTENLLSDVPVLNNGANIQYLEGYAREYNVEGYFSSVNYDYLEKFFVNASFRRDGSSVFHPDNRWGNFYGFGAAYELTKEAFMEDISAVNYLKLKASYGQQGNDALLYQFNRTITGDGDNRNYYAYLNQYEVVNAGGGVPGVNFVSLGNEDLVWETSTNINFGFESRLFDRVTLNVEYFQRNVDDMIFYDPLPVSEGRGFFPDNVGDMKNNGVEVEVAVDVLNSGDFGLSLAANVTTYKNEITRLPQEFIDDGNFRLEEGRSRYDYYMREFAGVDAENGDALWYVDEVGDDGMPTGNRITTNEWSDATEYFVGKSALPDFYGGAFIDVDYKDFGLDIGFSFAQGGYGVDGVYQSLLGSAGDIGNNFHKDVHDTWTPENTDASLPRLDVTDDDQSNTSDFFLTDKSYFALQNIGLSYNANFAFLDNIGISSAKFYIRGNNVKLWSERQGYDPRLSTIGTASNEYSLVRTWSIGTQLQF